MHAGGLYINWTIVIVGMVDRLPEISFEPIFYQTSFLCKTGFKSRFDFINQFVKSVYKMKLIFKTGFA